MIVRMKVQIKRDYPSINRKFLDPWCLSTNRLFTCSSRLRNLLHINTIATIIHIP